MVREEMSQSGESEAYESHEEYMMSQDDFHEHNMSGFDHDDDASCMEDMAEHRYYEHDMVDHHYDHGDELYTDYTSTSIIDEADHHINHDNFDYMSNIDMNHYYNFDTSSLDEEMEPYYTDNDSTSMKKMEFYTTFDSDMEYHYNNFIIDNMHEEMDCAPPMFKSDNTKLIGSPHYGSCSRRRIFKEDTTRSSHSPPPTARRRHNKATRKQGQATSLPRRRHEEIAIAHAQPSKHTKDIAKANARKKGKAPSTSRWCYKKATRQEGQAPSTSRWRNKNYVPPPMQQDATPSKKAKSKHPNDFRSHPLHDERQHRQETATSSELTSSCANTILATPSFNKNEAPSTHPMVPSSRDQEPHSNQIDGVSLLHPHATSFKKDDFKSLFAPMHDALANLMANIDELSKHQATRQIGRAHV